MTLKDTSSTSPSDLDEEIAESLPEEKHTTIRALARAAVLQAKGDRARATQLLFDQLERSPSLAREILEVSARYFIRQAEHDTRKKLRAPSQAARPSGDDAAGLVTVGEITKRWLDTYALEGTGVLLGDATRADLDAAVKLHETRAASHATSAAFLKQVFVCTQPEKRVRDCLTDKQVADLWERVSC